MSSTSENGKKKVFKRDMLKIVNTRVDSYRRIKQATLQPGRICNKKKYKLKVRTPQTIHQGKNYINYMNHITRCKDLEGCLVLQSLVPTVFFFCSCAINTYQPLF